MRGKKSRTRKFEGQKGLEGPEGIKCSPKQIVWVRDILHSMDTPSELEAKKRIRRFGFVILSATLLLAIDFVLILLTLVG